MGGQFGQQPQAAQAPGVAQAPYGSFAALPTVPEAKVGISTRPARAIAPAGGAGAGGGLRASPLLSFKATSSGVAPKLTGVQVSSLW
jgi:hypothetical protein